MGHVRFTHFRCWWIKEDMHTHRNHKTASERSLRWAGEGLENWGSCRESLKLHSVKLITSQVLMEYQRQPSSRLMAWGHGPKDYDLSLVSRAPTHVWIDSVVLSIIGFVVLNTHFAVALDWNQIWPQPLSKHSLRIIRTPSLSDWVPHAFSIPQHRYYINQT